MSAESESFLTLLYEVLRDFERQWNEWKEGSDKPDIQKALERFDESHRKEAFAKLLRLDFECRDQRNLPYARSDYCDAYPQCASLIVDLFAGEDALRDDSNTYSADDANHESGEKTVFEPIAGEPPTFDEGDAIGRYVAKRPLGRGAFGIVYLAWDNELERDVAIKVLTVPSLSRDEARTLAGLRHPGIVAIHDVGMVGGLPYLVMEYVGERSLSDLFGTELPTSARAVELMIPISEAVGHAHRHGVYHLDLKPANILIDADGMPHVVDFGLAVKEGSRDGMRQARVGTPSYMAPEQVRRQTDLLDGRADIWALGVILYEMLGGELPFKGSDTSQVFHEIKQRSPRPLQQIKEKIPRRLDRICRKCLEKDPDRRFQSTSELTRALRLWQRRRAILGAMVGAALLLTAATWQFFGPPSSDQGGSGPGSETPPGEFQIIIESMEIKHYRGDTLQPRGTIGVTSDGAIEDDDVRVKISLSRSAYCYLFAFNPDGSIQLCYPEDSAIAPAKSHLLDFPLGVSRYFGLTDGPGLQTFLLAVSDEPLPPYEEWQSQVDEPPWQTGLDANVVWRFTGGGPLESQFVQQQRGVIRQRSDPPPAFKALCTFFEHREEFTAIQAVAFPVKPKKATAVVDKGKDE